MTYVKFVDLGVLTTVRTSVITPVYPFLAKQKLKRKKIKNALEIFSPYKFGKSFVFLVEFSVALRVIKETTK
jgi:hypothetical protein